MEIRYEISNDTAMKNMSTVASSICAFLTGQSPIEDELVSIENEVLLQGEPSRKAHLIKVNSTKEHLEAGFAKPFIQLSIEVMIVNAEYFHKAYDGKGGLHGFVEELKPRLERIEQGLNDRAAKHMHPFTVRISIRTLV